MHALARAERASGPPPIVTVVSELPITFMPQWYRDVPTSSRRTASSPKAQTHGHGQGHVQAQGRGHSLEAPAAAMSRRSYATTTSTPVSTTFPFLKKHPKLYDFGQ